MTEINYLCQMNIHYLHDDVEVQKILDHSNVTTNWQHTKLVMVQFYF